MTLTLSKVFGLFGFLGPFIWALYILTLLMIIDCAVNRRDLYWFFIIIILGPMGGVVYLIYNFNQVTFPIPMSQLRALTQGNVAKRCPRCARTVLRLEPYQDARSTLYICGACCVELDQVRR